MRVQLSIVIGALRHISHGQDLVPRSATSLSTVAEATDTGDQRRARRVRGRAAVVDALIGVLEDGGPIPNASTIAELAGVSSASLFRYFDSIDELQRAAALEHFKRNERHFEIPDIGVGHLDARVAGFVEARAELYRRTAPVARFGRARSLEVPFFAEALRRVRLDQVAQIHLHFAQELPQLDPAAAEDLVSNIATLTSFESWELQHHDFGRDDEAVMRSWSHGIHAMLDQI